MKTDLNDITGRKDSTVEECNELRARIVKNRQEIGSEVIGFDMTTNSNRIIHNVYLAHVYAISLPQYFHVHVSR